MDKRTLFSGAIFTYMKTKKNQPSMYVPSLKLTGIAPENGWFEYYFPIGDAYFQGQTCCLVSGRVNIQSFHGSVMGKKSGSDKGVTHDFCTLS